MRKRMLSVTVEYRMVPVEENPRHQSVVKSKHSLLSASASPSTGERRSRGMDRPRLALAPLHLSHWLDSSSWWTLRISLRHGFMMVGVYNRHWRSGIDHGSYNSPLKAEPLHR